jgi:hypothetical protein
MENNIKNKNKRLDNLNQNTRKKNIIIINSKLSRIEKELYL